MADAHRRPRVPAWAILLAGLGVLIVAVAVAVVRDDRAADAEAADVEAQRRVYARLLEQADAVPPRVEVSYVALRLADLKRLTTSTAGRAAYQLVPTEISRRLRTGRPPVHPDFGSMRGLAPALALGFRQGRVRERPPWLAALLVTPTTPGRVVFRLRVERLVPHGYYEVYDLTDLVVRKGVSQSLPERRMNGTHRPGIVEATLPDGATGALVPLAILHLLSFAPTPANDDLAQAVGGGYGLQLTTGVALSPRRLFVGRPGGRLGEIAIGDALNQPLRLQDRAGG